MRQGEATSKATPTRLSVKVAAVVLVIAIAGALIEGGARLVYHYRGEFHRVPLLSRLLQRSLFLESYEIPAPRGGLHWVLRPGYEATLEQLIADKKRRRRVHGARTLESAVQKEIAGRDAYIRINRDGFKGPELNPAGSGPRVLALGDSVTFGLGPVDYPRVMQATFEQRGLSAEVINGGVEGYAPVNVLLEMERYKAVKPAVVTLFIGWNSLYSLAPWPDAWETRLRFVWLLRRAARTLDGLLDSPQAAAEALYSRHPRPNPAAPEVRGLDDYIPPFMGQVEQIADAFRSIGGQVYLVTLPGLFTGSEMPSSRAMKIGHLPYFTDNPFVLAKLTERYNIALRRLATRRNLILIDLEKWSERAFRPRAAYFSDSVHLTPEGLELVGAFMAERMTDQVERLQIEK